MNPDTSEEHAEQPDEPVSADASPPEEAAVSDAPRSESTQTEADEPESTSPEATAVEDTPEATSDEGETDAVAEETNEAADEAVKSDSEQADKEDVSDDAAARSNAEILPAKRGRGRRVLTVLAAVLMFGILLTVAGAAYATYDFKQEHDGKILPGATVAGVDVGGMTETEAISAVRKAIKPKLSKEITVELGDQRWKLTPKQLGARSNAGAAVRDALAASEKASWQDLAGMRFLDEELEISRDVSIRHSKAGAREFVEGLQKDVNADPVDAELDYSSGWVKVSKERAGRDLRVGDSTRSLMRALKQGAASFDLKVRPIEPEVTADSFDQVILVRQNDFRVYLYNDGKITHDWPIATGTSEYPTPTGVFSVELKRYMPTWVNPSPDGWGKSMPDQIPPGPDNPLGLRAINWTAPAIRFHGTSALSSIGTPASHGCVRMLNEDVIEMYDLVEVGTPIISIYG